VDCEQEHEHTSYLPPSASSATFSFISTILRVSRRIKELSERGKNIIL
jgi:hypothetical protein